MKFNCLSSSGFPTTVLTYFPFSFHVRYTHTPRHFQRTLLKHPQPVDFLDSNRAIITLIQYNSKLYFCYYVPCNLRGPCSSVGTATELRAGRSGDRIPVWARFSAPVQTNSGAHPASCTMGTGSLPGVKSGRAVTLTPHPLLVPLVIRVELYLYSPYRPYSLYRASVPVQSLSACTEPRCLYRAPIPFNLHAHE
jgi:hypothetical protein